MRVARDDSNLMAGRHEPIGEAGRIGCVAGRLWCEVERYYRNAKVMPVHRCNNSGKDWVGCKQGDK